ncbi:MAG: hypothetical protein ACRDHW_02415, partial [Ktedonobacteraceae bacterium]
LYTTDCCLYNQQQRGRSMITLDELKTLLKQHRWIIAISTSGNQQVYAAKQRQGEKVVTRYIGTANKLNSLTEEAILEKLNRRRPLASASETAPGAAVTTLNQESGLISPL